MNNRRQRQRQQWQPQESSHGDAAGAFDGWSAHLRYFLARYPQESRHFVAQRVAAYGIRSLLSSHRQEDLTLELLASSTEAADNDVLAMMKLYARGRRIRDHRHSSGRGVSTQAAKWRQQQQLEPYDGAAGTAQRQAVVSGVLRERGSAQDNIGVSAVPHTAPSAAGLKKHPVVAARPDVLTRYPFVDDLRGAEGGGVGGALHRATPTTPIQNLAKREIRRLAHEVFRELKASALGIKLSDLPSALQILFFGDSASSLTSKGNSGQQAAAGRKVKDVHLVMALAREALPASLAQAARDVSTLSSASTHGGPDGTWTGDGQTMFISEKRWIKLVAHVVRRLWEMDGVPPSSRHPPHVFAPPPPPRATRQSAAAAAGVSIPPYAITFQQPSWRPVGTRTVGTRDAGGAFTGTHILGGGEMGAGYPGDGEGEIDDGLSSLGVESKLGETGFVRTESDGFSARSEPITAAGLWVDSVSVGEAESEGYGRSSSVVVLDNDLGDVVNIDKYEGGEYNGEADAENDDVDEEDHESLMLRAWEQGQAIGETKKQRQEQGAPICEEWVGAGRSMALASPGDNLDEVAGVIDGCSPSFEVEGHAHGIFGPRRARGARGLTKAKRVATAGAARRFGREVVGGSGKSLTVGEKEGTRGAGMWEVTPPHHVAARMRAGNRRRTGGTQGKIPPYLRGVQSRIGPQLDAHKSRLKRIANARNAAVRDVVARRRLAELDANSDGGRTRGSGSPAKNASLSSRGHSPGEHALDIAGAFLESSLMTRLAGGDWFDAEGGDDDPISGDFSSWWEPEGAVKAPPLRRRHSRGDRVDTGAGSRGSKPRSPRLASQAGVAGPTRVATAARRRAHTGWLGDFGPAHTHTVQEQQEEYANDTDPENEEGGGYGGGEADDEGGAVGTAGTEEVAHRRFQRRSGQEESGTALERGGGDAMFVEPEEEKIRGEDTAKDGEIRERVQDVGSAVATAVNATIATRKSRDAASAERHVSAAAAASAGGVVVGVACDAGDEFGTAKCPISSKFDESLAEKGSPPDGVAELSESVVGPSDGGLDAYLQLAADGRRGDLAGSGPAGGAYGGTRSGGDLLAPGSGDGTGGSAGGYTGATTGSWWEDDRSGIDASGEDVGGLGEEEGALDETAVAAGGAVI